MLEVEVESVASVFMRVRTWGDDRDGLEVFECLQLLHKRLRNSLVEVSA